MTTRGGDTCDKARYRRRGSSPTVMEGSDAFSDCVWQKDVMKMTAAEALAFIEQRGVVLVSARGPIPRLTEVIAGEPIKGSWWGHPKGHQIFVIVEAVTESEDVLVCRLVKGKITLVHRRLWPALVRLANRFSPDKLAQVKQEHTSSGRHVNKEVPFPHWVPAAVTKQAKSMSEADAIAALGEWATAALHKN